MHYQRNPVSARGSHPHLRLVRPLPDGTQPRGKPRTGAGHYTADGIVCAAAATLLYRVARELVDKAKDYLHHDSTGERRRSLATGTAAGAALGFVLTRGTLGRIDDIDQELLKMP
ncbi:MAG: hypothetical protein HYW26_00750 [Candidatus Aenigmarchaeota archaeon]|nr:hypothetical protein [Candidatus Aenigmarchaeota archaeon]